MRGVPVVMGGPHVSFEIEGSFRDLPALAEMEPDVARVPGHLCLRALRSLGMMQTHARYS